VSSSSAAGGCAPVGVDAGVVFLGVLAGAFVVLEGVLELGVGVLAAVGIFGGVAGAGTAGVIVVGVPTGGVAGGGVVVAGGVVGGAVAAGGVCATGTVVRRPVAVSVLNAA